MNCSQPALRMDENMAMIPDLPPLPKIGLLWNINCAFLKTITYILQNLSLKNVDQCCSTISTKYINFSESHLVLQHYNNNPNLNLLIVTARCNKPLTFDIVVSLRCVLKQDQIQSKIELCGLSQSLFLLFSINQEE